MDHARICFSFISIMLACRVNGQCTPQDLAISLPSSRQLTVTWRCNDGGSLQQSFREYQVNYQLTNIGQCQAVTEESVGDGFRRRIPTGLAIDFSATLAGLRPYSSYTIEVVSRRADNQMTSASESIFATTDQDAPDAGPTNILRAAGASDSEYTYSWDPIPCDERNGEVQMYKYVLTRLGDPSTQVTSGSTSPRSVTINTGMHNGCNVQFRFEVAATTVSEGPYSNQDFSIGTVPETIRNLRLTRESSTEFDLSWDAPETNCPVTQYSVRNTLVRRDQCEDVTEQVYSELVQPTTTLTFTGLEPYSTYSVVITPKNDKGDGQESDISVMTGQEAPETKPTNVIHTEISDNVYTFTWDPIPCTYRNGAVQYKYILTRQDTNTVVRRDSTSTTSVTINTGALDRCFVQFRFEVAASTVSDGPYGEHDFSVQRVPESINNLQVTTTSSTGFVLSWNAPDTDCHVTQYSVRNTLVRRDQCEDVMEQVSNESVEPTTTLMFTGLEPYSTYSVVITPQNGEEFGTESIISVETGQAAPETPPTNIQRTNTSDNVYTFTWDPIPCTKRNGEVQYKYILERLGDTNMLVGSGTTSTTSVPINTGVLDSCNVQLRFKVAASTVSDGPYSVEHNFYVQRVPEIIRNMRVTRKSSTGFDLSWDPPDTNCAVTRYFMRNTLVRRDQCEVVMEQVSNDFVEPTTTLTVIVTGLEPYSTYSVVITPRNDKGFAQGSTISVQTDQAAPTVQPSNLMITTHTQCELGFSWNLLPCGSRGGIITYTYELHNLAITDQKHTGSSMHNGILTKSLNCLTNYRFRLRAKNEGGEGPWSDDLDVSTTLTAPSGLTLAKGKTTFHATWMASNGNCMCSITYQIEYKLTHTDQCRNSQSPVRMTGGTTADKAYTLTGLFPYSTYIVYVIPVVGGRRGTEASVEGVTRASAPTVKPSSLMVTVEGSCSLGFSWNHLPCGRTGGAITYTYELHNLLTPQTQSDSTTSNEVSIGSLDCLTTYKFRIRADNTGGEGTYTDYVQTSTTLAAQVMEITPKETELYVAWVAQNENCACPITYDIEYSLTNAGQCGNIQGAARMAKGTTTNNAYTLEGLFPYSTYIVYITPAVEGRRGEEGSMETITSSSAPTVGPLITVNENLKTSSSIQFSWEEIPCESRGSPIQRYNYRLTDGSMTVADDVTSSLSVSITGLEADHMYTFSLSATNTIGTGPNKVVTASTLPVGPNPPGSVTFVQADKTSLEFSWATASCEGYNGCNSIAEYSYTLVALPAGEPVEQMTTSTSATITDLNPCTMYDFRVAARSDSGMTGPYSGAVSATTALDMPSPISNSLRNDETSSTTLVITWTKPDGPCPVDNYNVQYRITERDMCQQIDEHPEETIDFGTVETTRVEIPSLEPFSTYIIWITPGNQEGLGDRQSTRISTGEQKPSAAPVNIRSTSVWATNASFVWDEVQCGNMLGVIQRYFCQIAPSSDPLVIIEQEPLTRMATLNGLQPCTAYTFSVAAITDAGTGPMSNDIPIMTKNTKPLSVSFPQGVDSVLSSTARFQWNPSSTDSPGSCPAFEYLVKYQLINNDQCQAVESSPLEVYDTVSTTEVFLSDLILYSTYKISVTARNDGGDADPSHTEIVTATGKPTGVPLNVIVSDVQKRSLTFSWSLPTCGERRGDIAMYFYELKATNAKTTIGETTNTSVEILALTPFVNYTFRVAAATSAGQGPFSEGVVAQTKEDLPTAPTDLSFVPSPSFIEVTWKKPNPPHGTILKYHIEYWPSSDMSMTETNMTTGTETTFSLYGLQLGDEYSVRVRGETSAGKGQWSGNKTVTTSIPKPQPPNVMVSDTVVIVFEKLPEYISNVYIAAQQVTSRRRRRQSDDDAFIVANLTRGDIDESSSFTVGDNETYGGYENKVLENGATYNISVAYVSCITKKCFKTWSDPATVQVPVLNGKQNDPDSGGVLVSTLVPIVIVIILVVLLTVAIILKRDKIRSTIAERNKGFTNDEEMAHDNPTYDDDIKEKDPVETPIPDAEPAKEPPSQPSPMLPPATPSRRRKQPQSQKQPGTPTPTRKVRRDNVIPVNKIQEYIHEQTSGDRNGFVEEFKEIPGDSQIHEWNDAELAENYRNKNRFINIMPYDHSRVKLEIGGEDPVLNFINASLIKVYDDKCFIATHGPLPDIFEDTWQLVWEQNITKIIMVTNLVEKKMIKCHKYWPDVVTTYGQFEVRPLTVEKYANYTIRGFRLSMIDEEIAMEIKQFHFTSWPDFGVPKYPTPLLNFMKAVNAFDPQDSGPPIIHCSAGVGRTGTYITIDSMMKMAKDTGNINVPDFVAQIRDFRINMVQTSQQYQFIYEALYEALLLDNTSILVTNLREEHMKLSVKIKKGEDKGKTGFERELKILNELTYKPVGDQGAGSDPCNADKNRFPDKIPDEKDRPSLAIPGDEDSTDYINAAYLDGRRLKDIFLATQMPMPSTQGDIWRMVYDHYSYVIVMLNDMDKKDATIAQYWPEEASVISVGPLQIEFQSTQKLDDKILGRSFKITNTQFPDQDSRIVLQLQYTDWPANKDVPNSAKTFLALASLVQNHHDQNGNVGPITVHCMNGIGRSGVFCALLSVIDKMKSDKMVDVFQEVKRLRMSRSGMVENGKQYKFLYDVALVYLDQYGSYENFSPTGSLMHGQKPPTTNGVFGESSETESTEGDHASK